jgi:C-terminal processing protease CtpA/Prc
VTLTRDEIDITESRKSAKFSCLKENDREKKIGILSLLCFYGDNEEDGNISNGATEIVGVIQKSKAKSIDRAGKGVRKFPGPPAISRYDKD